jgi:hypothetical protein
MRRAAAPRQLGASSRERGAAAAVCAGSVEVGAVAVRAVPAVRGVLLVAHAGARVAALAACRLALVQRASSGAGACGFAVGARHNMPFERTAFGRRSLSR